MTNQQLDMFDYWEPQEDTLERDSDPSGHVSDPRDKTPLQMVKEYQEVSGQQPDPVLYRSLIHEEFFEWDTEWRHITKAPQLKELADLVYVIYGYANARGWDLDMALLRVHENNMGRMYQPDGTIRRRDDGKIVKNKDYPQVELSDLV